MQDRGFVAVLAMLMAVASFSATPVDSAYTLKYNYAGTNFFDNFDFWSADDPTHGYVDYVTKEQAQGLPSGHLAFYLIN